MTVYAWVLASLSFPGLPDATEAIWSSLLDLLQFSLVALPCVYVVGFRTADNVGPAGPPEVDREAEH